MKEEKLPV